MEYTKGEWKACFNPGVTGPTTPSPTPFCGGRDWPYRTINVGQETIAICPAQDKSKPFIGISEPDINEMKANANLIVAAVNACQEVNPDNPMAVAEALQMMYEALKAWDKLRAMHPLDSGADIDEIFWKCCAITDKALIKAEGK